MNTGVAMTELFARIVAIFDTTAGMAVLGMAVLALVGLFVFVFWDTIRVPRHDAVSGDTLKTAPPPLLSPDMVGRSTEGGWTEDRTMLLRNAVLLVIGVFLVAGGVVTFRGIQDQAAINATRVAAENAAPVSVQSVRDGFPGTPDERPSQPATEASAYCEEAGSMAERYMETCVDGAAVRFDLLRLTYDDRYVVRPEWNDAAPTFVGSSSHAAPFTLGKSAAFAAPETVGAQRYDGYLVIGVGAPGEEAVQDARARALRDFAIVSLSGGDRSECLGSETIYSVSASFDDARVTALKTLRAETKALKAAARRGGAPAAAAYAAAEEKLARMELIVDEKPAPIIIGITTDPASSDPQRDMAAAAEVLLMRHYADLQIAEWGAVTPMKACARGEMGR